MKLLSLLLTFSMLVTSCFDSSSEDQAGGGLFSGHKVVDDAFTIQLPASKTYAESENIDFVLVHPTNVTVSGNPRLILDIGGSTVYADYVAGSGTNILVFRYTVAAGDNDLDGLDISVGSVDLNGGSLKISVNGSIKDANTAIPEDIDSSGLLVDTTAPAVSSLVAPIPGTYFLGDDLTFVITFDEPVNITGAPQLDLDIDGANVKAQYQSGTGGSVIIFRYEVGPSDKDDDGSGIALNSPIELNGGTIQDMSGNSADLTFTPPNLTLVNVNGEAPFVTNYTLPVNATYFNGEMLEFDLQFSEVVTVTGTPRLPLDIGGNSENAVYLNGTGTDTLRFRYIVKAGDKDTNGISIGGALNLTGATIQDLGGEDAIEDINPPLTPYIYVNGDIPTITSITAPADNNYTTGQTLDFIVQFSENVYVTGSPSIALTLDSGAVVANYMVGSGSKNLTFRYIVTASDQDNNGPTFSSTALDLGIGTIKSTATAQNADLNYNGTEPNITNVRLNESPGTQVAITQQPTNAYENSNIAPAITVEIRDASNNLVTGATDNVTLAIATNPAGGTLAGTVTVAAVGGIATFSDIQINNAGVGYTLVASATGLTSDTSNTFDILSADPTQLAFVTQPSNTVAGSNIAPSITVEIRDGAGTLVNTATDNVTIAFGTDPSGSTATLGGTLTVAAVAGVATFSDINIDKAFTGYTLTASATGLTSDTSTAFNITAAPKAQLAFIQEPTDALSGVNITPAITVEIQDTYGNKTSDTDSITLAINNNPSTGTLSGTTSVAAVNGTATFSDINIDNAGIGYTLDATATGLTTATSAAFTISSLATQLVITQEPSDTYNNTAIAPAITVEIRDASNNLVSVTDNVTVAIGTNPAGGTLAGTLTVAAVGGVATFSDLEIDNVGIGYTLDFSATGLTGATSTTFDITQSPPTQLAFVQEPTDAVAGVNIAPAITVEIRDAGGNLVPTATDNVTLAFGTDPSGSTATLGGTLTIAAIGGVATFNDINIDKAFTGYTLSASATGLTAATSASFDITPAAATQLAFTQEPSDAEYNTNIAPAITVDILDAYGNKTADTDTISLAINNNPSAGTLAGTVSVAAVAGTATFSDIQIDNVGVGYTLDASATGLTTATSAAFNIISVPTQLVITQHPTNAYNQTTIAPAITVEIRDAANNIVTTATDNVSLAFGVDASGGSATISGTTTVAAVAGVATFNDISIDEIASGYTFYFSATGLTGAASTSFDITQAPATQLALVQEPTDAVAGVNIAPAITVEIQDANGNVVPTATDNVTLAIASDPSTGSATLGGTLTVAAVNGVATFSDINIDKAFTGYTLGASATGLTAATSATFNISAATKAALAFSQEPSDSPYNTNISPAITVDIVDAYGNKTADTDTITLAINNNPSAGTLSGTLAVAAIAGTATFSDIQIDNPGVGYTLDATATGLTSATSTSLEITQVATQIVITQEPSDAYNSTAISPAITVELRDAANNLVTGATNNVTVAIGTNPAAGTLGGTLTVAAVGGVATFNDLEIDNVGVGYTLDFSATGLTSATSATFNITQAPATKLAFVQQPTNAVAGVNISPAITVEIRDANDNVVPTATDNITIGYNTDPSAGAATLGGTLTVSAINGVATFSDINLDKAFTGYALQATATGLTAASSTNFNITPATKAKLAFIQEPTNAEYNSNIAPAITVEIQDAYGNKTADTDSITLAINNNPTGGTLAGTLSAAAVAGTATFSDISIDTAGVGYTLNATAAGLTTATSSSFDITATATQLVITQEPSDAYNSTAIAPAITVELRDAQNNKVASATDNVSVTISTDPSGSATLGGTTTVAAVAGVATFSDLEIDNVANGYILTFTSGGLTNAVSSTFNITQAPATQVAFVQNPTSTVAGTNITPAITVEIQDANGNKVPGATDNVSLAFGTDPSSGAATLGGTLTVAAVNGVATFSDINIDKAFTGYTLQAGAAGLTADTSSLFNITPATKAKLAFVQEPSDSEYNTNIAPAITVEIQDTYGNKTADTDNITIAINNNPTAGTLSGTTTVAAVAGIATFSDLQINNVGIGYTLDATAGGLTTATSSAFNISATPTQLVITQGPSDAYNSSVIAPAITVELRDASNNLVSGATNNVTLAFGTDPSSGTATISGTTTVAAVGGIATFSDIEVDKVFNGYTLTFTSTGLTSATSATFNITQAPATQLAFTVQPSNTVAGSNISLPIIVQIQDANGLVNPLATDNVTLAFSSDPSSGAATLGGTVTVAAIAGIATFSDINIDKAHTGYSLQASAAGLTSDTSTAFNITPATKAALAFSQEPSNAQYNTNISPAIKVDIVDAYGNKTTDTDSITLAINNNPSGGTLAGTLSISAVAGTATFSDIQIDAIGNGYTLDATAAGLTGATSTSFNIEAGAPTQLVITQQPSNASAGANISPAITVELRDAGNNLVSSATNTVVLSFDTDPSSGAATIGGTTSRAAVGGVATFNDINIDKAYTGYKFDFASTALTGAISAAFDITGPYVTSVTPPTDGTYYENQNLDFIVNTSENVNVTGTPRIQLDIGGTTKYADYVSGTRTNALTFRYTVEANLSDLNGIGASSPMDLNSGTIQNASLENLDLTFTPPALTNVLVDSTDPTVAITTPAEASYINVANNSATFTVSGTCSEAGQTVTIEVDGGAAASPVGFGCNGSNFTGTIDTTGLAPGAHTLVAKIQDAALNEGISTTINITKDASAPTISSVTVPIPNNYIVGNNLNFVVNLDEATNVTGTPRIQIDIGGVTKYANYNSGTGTSALTFRYTIQNGDYDTNGLGYVSTSIDLNGGTLLDVASNPINLDMEATVGLPSLASVNVYGILPTVSITSAPDITAANQTAYTVSGACDQEGRSVTVNIDGLIFSPTCSSSAWTTGAVNVTSRLDNAALPITADLDDAAGNNATQATTTVNKDTANPTVTITFSPDISAANDTNYAVSGTCTDVGQIVDVNVDDGVNPVVNVQPNCSGGTWTSGALDVSSLNDGTITITADHLTATTASVNVNKDTTSSIVVISSAPNINGGNETSYIASGTCSDNGVMVDVNIGSLNFTPNCNTGSWTTGLVDVSSLPDGPVLVTADHATASQATANISKNTSTPTISSLSVPTTLKDSIDLNWSLNDPGGFTINDYQIQYRIKGTGTWLPFSDGVSTNTFATVTGLTASTIYEAKVRVQYNTSNYSDWSVIAEGTTKPDDPLFTSPHMVMNVGGATDTKVVAMYDTTEIFHNGLSIGTINAGQTLVVPGGTAQFDTIDADKPIYTAGNLGGTNTGATAANIVWQPTAWAGTSFSFNAIRSDPQSVHVYAVENATVTVKNGSTILAGPTAVSAGTGTTLQWNAVGSFQVVATDLILAFHTSRNTETEDPKPLLPSSNEIIGFPSNSMRLTADVDATNYIGYHSDDTFESGNLNKPDVVPINPTGGTTSLYQSNSLLITADQKVAGASFADGNGFCAAPFLPTNLMKKKYMINVSSNWVAFASKQAGTIEVYSPGQVIGVDTPVSTMTLTRSGTNPGAPYKARTGTTPEGYRFVSNVPMAGWYQPDTSNQAGNEDETILYGTDD